MGDTERLGIYREYVRQFGIDPKKRERRNGRPGQHWTPRRSCFRDWLISAYVVRWGREHYEVGLFLAEELYLLERGSGVKSGLMFILSDAYHRTGRMAVTFVGPAPGVNASLTTGYEPRIPSMIVGLARELGVTMPDLQSIPTRQPGQVGAKLPDAVGRELYARITGFSANTVRALSIKGGPDLTRACFIVQRGIWSVEQVEYICEQALFPRRLLEGGIAPERRLSFVHDLAVLRVTLLWERARVTLIHLSGQDEAVVSAKWLTHSVAEFSSTNDLKIRLSDGVFPISPGTPLRILLLPRSEAEYRLFAARDAVAGRSSRAVLAAVTRDYFAAGDGQLEKAGLRIMEPVETLLELDREIFRRLASSVTTARAVSERPE